MPVLNNGAVVGGLARACNVYGIKVPDRQVIIIRQFMQEGKLVQIDARTIHATGTDPSGLGMMQPERRSQQSKLKMQKHTQRRDKPMRPGDNATRGAPPTE